MKLFFSHRFYYPDTAPYALMLRSIAEHFAAQGHDVHVFSSVPSYRKLDQSGTENVPDSVSVRRCWVFPEKKGAALIRLVNVFLYCGSLFFNILRQKPDVVTASTFPPVIAGWTASLAARLVGAKFVYHLMDIHPEVSKYSGGKLGKGLTFRLLRWLDNQTLRRSTAIVVLSEDMADTLNARGLGDLPVTIINNFLLESFAQADPYPKELKKEPGKYRVIFAGNLGRFQNLPVLVEGIWICLEKHPELELLLLGDGALLPELKQKWGDHPQIRFSPFLPFAQAKELIADADLGLVSLAPDLFRVAYPSKMLTYLGLGLPILALVETQSRLARTISDANLGVVPERSTPNSIATTLEWFLEQDVSKEERKNTILNWYSQNNAKEKALEEWKGTIEGLA